MRRLSIILACSALALSASGCWIYFDDDDDCLEPAIAALELRNPESGQCEAFGGGGHCDVALGAPERSQALPDWGECYSHCTGLGEDGCLDTSGCRAIYMSDCPDTALCETVNYEYADCWATAMSGPIQGGSCEGLDAHACSRHDDCVAYHAPLYQDCSPDLGCDDFGGPVPGYFESCGPEPGNPDGCYSDADCDEGDRCNADEVCLPPPDCEEEGGCEPVCYGECVPDEPDAGSCHKEVACDALPPECPAGTVPGVEGACWSGYCIPYDECDPPIDPGACWEEAQCRAEPPPCPDDSVPGVANGCWTGYCIPLDQCEADQPCEDVAGEAQCIGRTDCAPIYQGVDCTCDENGCTCDDWLFDSCQTGAAPLYLSP